MTGSVSGLSPASVTASGFGNDLEGAALETVCGRADAIGGLFRVFPLDASHSASFAFLSSAVSIAILYWLKERLAGGLGALLSVAATTSFALDSLTCGISSFAVTVDLLEPGRAAASGPEVGLAGGAITRLLASFPGADCSRALELVTLGAVALGAGLAAGAGALLDTLLDLEF